MGHEFLISTKRSFFSEILAKLNIEIFTKDYFPEFISTIHDPANKNLFQKKINSMLNLHKSLQFLEKYTKNVYGSQIFIPQNVMIFGY